MERLNYIDSLKGVAIILVVIGNLMSFSFGTNCLYKYIYIFHMPLFMFLSGYVMNGKQNISLLKRRLTKLLVPFLIIGISFSYYHGNDIFYFITDFFKSGYWYLYCLSVFYVFFFILYKLSSLSSRKGIIMKTLSIIVFIIFIIFQKCSNEQLVGGIVDKYA